MIAYGYQDLIIKMNFLICFGFKTVIDKCFINNRRMSDGSLKLIKFLAPIVSKVVNNINP